MQASDANCRRIMHVDMDAFFASVEQRDHPELRGKPIIVGGSGPRGVVAAASYEVRQFGVYSAMPVRTALQKCPHLIIVPPRMQVYQSVSAQVFDRFRAVTPDVEGLSLDEAFLDVTGNRLLATARELAIELRATIKADLGLTASVGIGPNKFIAKLASDHGKPDGLFEVSEQGVQAFLDPLPVRRIWGLGKVTGGKLERAGIDTVQRLRETPLPRLTQLLGKQANHFLALANGIDSREVERVRGDKSISAEVTFDQDSTDRAHLHDTLFSLADRTATRLRKAKLLAGTVTVKLRRSDFKTFTRQKSVKPAADRTDVIFEVARDLFDRWWQDQDHCPVRLLGVGSGGLIDVGTEESDLLAPQKTDIDRLADQIRTRFGEDAASRGRLVKAQKPPAKD
ncbi:MAG: DNA polymerase IV [Lysobacteraceae bacterium]|nr:MAG: DNA polymerase IV [Xanthomonadaceae bacterium]